ncbi:MAG: hypothetical protein ACRD09_15585 [Vicinamibacterales bacterium]
MLLWVVALGIVQAASVFTVAVRYGSADRTAWTRDLHAIRALGFTAVVVPDDRVEPIRAAAAEAELQVIAKRDENTPPTVVLDGSGPPSALRYRGWTAIRHGARAIAFALDADIPPAPNPVEGRQPHLRAAGAFAGSVAGSARLFLTMKPIDGARPTVVDARLFQSGQALVLIALNHHDAPREGIITLPPSTPLAEWVNLETGEVAYFDRVPDGVAYRHQFGTRDALVLVIRRDIQ